MWHVHHTEGDERMLLHFAEQLIVLFAHVCVELQPKINNRSTERRVFIPKYCEHSTSCYQEPLLFLAPIQLAPKKGDTSRQLLPVFRGKIS